MTEGAKKHTLRNTMIGVVGSVLTAGVTLGVTTWSESVSARDLRIEEMLDRVQALEADRSKWELLAEHETRLREAEIAARVHQALLERLHPVIGHSELAAQQKAAGALLAGPPKAGEEATEKPPLQGPPAKPESRPAQAQQALPRLKVNPDDLRRQYQRGPVKRIKK